MVGRSERVVWMQNTAGSSSIPFSAFVMNGECGLAIVGWQSCAEYHYLTDKDTVPLSDVDTQHTILQHSFHLSPATATLPQHNYVVYVKNK